MFWDDEKLLVYFDGEEHIVRRLGAAVVSLWAQLDPIVREQLIARAGRMLDDDGADTMLDAQAIGAFLRHHEQPTPCAAVRAPHAEARLFQPAICRPS